MKSRVAGRDGRMDAGEGEERGGGVGEEGKGERDEEEEEKEGTWARSVFSS